LSFVDFCRKYTYIVIFVLKEAIILRNEVHFTLFFHFFRKINSVFHPEWLFGDNWDLVPKDLLRSFK